LGRRAPVISVCGNDRCGSCIERSSSIRSKNDAALSREAACTPEEGASDVDLKTPPWSVLPSGSLFLLFKKARAKKEKLYQINTVSTFEPRACQSRNSQSCVNRKASIVESSIIVPWIFSAKASLPRRRTVQPQSRIHFNPRPQLPRLRLHSSRPQHNLPLPKPNHWLAFIVRLQLPIIEHKLLFFFRPRSSIIDKLFLKLPRTATPFVRLSSYQARNSLRPLTQPHTRRVSSNLLPHSIHAHLLHPGCGLFNRQTSDCCSSSA